MSIKVMSLVWDRFPEGGNKMFVLLALADWCDDDGGSLYPSISKVARKCRISSRQVQRIMRDLEEECYIRVVGNHEGGKPGSTRRYHVNVSHLLSIPVWTGDKMTGVSQPCHHTGDTDVTQSISEPSEVVSTKRGTREPKTSTTERGGRVSQFEDRGF